MEGARLLVLLSSLWSGGVGLHNATHSRITAPEEGNFQKNMASTSYTLNQSLQPLPTTHIMAPEATQTPEGRASEDSLLTSTSLPTKPEEPPEFRRNQTQTHHEKTPEVQTPAPLSKSSVQLTPRAESLVLSNSTLEFLQSFARTSSQQAISLNSTRGLGNRAPRQTYLSRGDNPGRQRTNFQKSSFETTRGKNWCAYVHTRLSPTVVLDHQVTHVPSGKAPCSWVRGSCPQRSQKASSPVYKMQHKIVTSLEWKCCPGFSGNNCQMKVQEQHQLIHSAQAESHAAVGQGTEEQKQRQRDCDDPAVTRKITEQLSHQAVRLSLLQKEIDNISLAVSEVKNTHSSLEEKINEDKGGEFQHFLKGLKSKSLNDLVRDIVREQFQTFQTDTQETVAQLFKTVSWLSEELESTRQTIRQVNESVVSIAVQQKALIMQENKPILTDILDLKKNVVNIRQEMNFTCEKPIKELEAKQMHLENALEQEHLRSIFYHESFNKTLSDMKEGYGHLSPTEQMSEQKSVLGTESVGDGVSEDLSTLHEKIQRQDLRMSQLFDDLQVQDSKIDNLTISLEMKKESVRSEWENMLSKHRSDLEMQIREAEDNVQILNQTLVEVVFPMDKKMDKMKEQINDLIYDMEILQPLLEEGPSLKQRITNGQSKEDVVTKKKLDNLTGAVNTLNFLLKELTKNHNLLRSEVQSRSYSLDRRIDEYASEMEDGLNKTMTIINNAIDFIQDNYVLKETFSTIEINSGVHHDCNQNMKTILTFISQFQHLNDSIEILINDNQRYSFVLQVAKALADIPKEEKLGGFSFQKIHQMLNETTSQVIKYQQNVSHLEEIVHSASKNSTKFETRLQDIESKLTKMLIPYYVSLKKGGEATKEKDQALQLQVLSSRFKALEAKSIYLSMNLSLLNKTVHETLMMCHDVSAQTSELNATIPKWIKGSLTDIQLFQKDMREFVESIIEMKTQVVLSNLTWYVNRSLSSGLANPVKFQKQFKPFMKKPNTLKKPTANFTNILTGRAQRNTNDIQFPEKYPDCSGSPCRNGGTCVDGRSSFTCACRHPFTGARCSVRLGQEDAPAPDFSKGSYRYAPMVAFFASHTYGMTTPGPILFNNLDVNYGASYTPRTGKFRVPYLGVYVFKYTIESFSAHVSGFLVVDGVDKLTFESENINSDTHCDRVLTGDALLELNYGQEVWLRLVKGTIPAKFPPVTTFSGYLLYRT
ncbi:multimerin-1-like [Sorex araneus]|uniref:multimerin-1-like n=1 Tax=Sorex araneus TaxID=42254 RepID=UPI0024339785|nr:multimerin-1-like [Sorex araneus]